MRLRRVNVLPVKHIANILSIKNIKKMRKIVLMMLLVVLFCVTAKGQRTFVLVTGVSNYKNSENNLTQSTKDAKAFKNVILKQTPDVTILTSKYANRSNIIEKLRAICNRATKRDRIIFFFSGHGLPGGIMAYDGVISYGELTMLLQHSEAKLAISFIDACHAGSVTNGKNELVGSLDDSKNLVFFMSCRDDEYSAENPWVGAGFFTQSLLKGIRGKADMDSNRNITVMELFQYIYKDVLHRTKNAKYQQHPQLIAPKNTYEQTVMHW